jgi:hypothetical protein
VEGSHNGLDEHTVPALIWRGLRKPGKELGLANLNSEIWARDLNIKREFRTLKRKALYGTPNSGKMHLVSCS